MDTAIIVENDDDDVRIGVEIESNNNATTATFLYSVKRIFRHNSWGTILSNRFSHNRHRHLCVCVCVVPGGDWQYWTAIVRAAMGTTMIFAPLCAI